MFSFGSTMRLLVAAGLVGAAPAAAQDQTAANQQPKTAAEIASSIAATITANFAKAPNTAIAFASASAHDNVVEIRYLANDLAAFSRLRSNADKVRSSKSFFYCNESRIAYLKQGALIHEVIATPDGSDQVDFTFDTVVCDSLVKPALADPAKLADFALVVAKAENDNADKAAGSPLRLDGVTAHDGVVDERFVVADEQAKSNAQENRGSIVAATTGYFCGKYRDFILQGLAIHHAFVLPDGSPVIDFTIDRSKC